MANITVSRKPEKNKACIQKQEGRRIRYYCVEKKELKDYLYDILYMQENNINLAVRIVPEKKKYYEYVIAGDRIQINEKELTTDQDPESYIATEYLGEPIVIIKEPLKKIKKLYGPPWYQDKQIIALIVMWVIIIFGGAVFLYLKSHQNRELTLGYGGLAGKPPPPPMGKSLGLAQKTSIMESFTKDALYQIAYAIEQVSSIGYPAYISDITYFIKDEKAAPGKDEKLSGSLDITFRFAYPAKGSKLVSTKPVPIYSKTVHIDLAQGFPVKVSHIDEETCGMKLLKDGLNLYDVDNLEFKGDIKNYKDFYDFIQTMFYCKGYIESLKLTNPNDILSKNTNSAKNPNMAKKNIDINANIDLYLIKNNSLP
ncbi:hypothetical protein [Hydrogenobaculum sp.]